MRSEKDEKFHMFYMQVTPKTFKAFIPGFSASTKCLDP